MASLAISRIQQRSLSNIKAYRPKDKWEQKGYLLGKLQFAKELKRAMEKQRDVYRDDPETIVDNIIDSLEGDVSNFTRVAKARRYRIVRG